MSGDFLDKLFNLIEDRASQCLWEKYGESSYSECQELAEEAKANLAIQLSDLAFKYLDY